MKKLQFLLTTLILLMLTSTVFSQITISLKPSIPGGSIVKDSTGRIMPSEEWQALASSGQYMAKPVEGTQPKEYLLLRMSQQQKDSVYKRVLGSARVTTETSLDMNSMPSSGSGSTTQTYDSKPVIDNPAPQFSVTDIHNNSWELGKLKGKVIVINSWFINCMPCIKEMPELNKLAEQYKNADIVFIAINPVDLKEEISNFISKTPFNYHQIADTDAKKMAKEYGFRVFPTNIIIDREGIIKYASSAYSSNTISSLKEQIEKLL